MVVVRRTRPVRAPVGPAACADVERPADTQMLSDAIDLWILWGAA
jgi:hypothetical protein